MAPRRYFDSAGKRGDDKVVVDGADLADAAAGTSSSVPSAAATDKQKARQANRSPQTTLFVSSLPFTATSTDLTTFFSDIGPLRRAFVVTDKETGKSKGVGYVTFALREDAERALGELQGRSLDGKQRKMRIEWSTGKLGDAPGAAAQTPSEPRQAPAKPSSGAVDRDPDAVRTIIIAGLAQCKPAADSKSLYKRVRKAGDVENVIYPAPASITSTDVLSDDYAHVVFRTPNHAMLAVPKLHAHTFKGAQLSVVLKKRADGAARLEAHMRPETKAKRDALKEEMASIAEAQRIKQQAQSNTTQVNRGSRLIIRNLPFDVTERDMRAVFLPFGPIYSIDVPQKVAPGGLDAVVATEESEKEKEGDEDGDEEVEGDEDASEKDSEESSDKAEEDTDMDVEADDAVDVPMTDESEASKKPSGRGRGFAFVWFVSRSDAANAIKAVNGTLINHGAAEKAQLKAANGKAGRLAAKEALEKVSKNAQAGRQVAVDWALSKKEWESKKDESEAEDTEAEDGEDADEDEDDSDLDPVELKDGDDEEDEDDQSDEEDKPALPQPEQGTTLFIRNVPYQTTEEELRNLFRTFGPLRYAKVTMDKATNRAKGTAFACFWQKDDADKVLQQARLVEQESGAHSANKDKKKNPFSAPTSVLTADPSAPLTSSLMLHGRVLSVVAAVDRTQAESLATTAQSIREKKDKRNTYLMREGVPMPNSALAERLNEREINRRLEAFQMRKAQMMKNPSLYISKTRLSVRHLPLFVSEKLLKRLAEHAVKAFDEEVAAGQREGLTAVELAESRTHAQQQKHTTAAALAEDGLVDEGDKKSKKQSLKLKRQQAMQRRMMTNKGGFVVMQSKVIRAKDRLDTTTGAGRSQGYGFIEMTTFADALKVVRLINGDKKMHKLLLQWYAEELGDLAKKMQAPSATLKMKKEEADEHKARLQRIVRKKSELDAGQLDAEEDGMRGGLLAVEFSIENIVTVKRRAERGKQMRRKENGPGHKASSSSSAAPSSSSSSRLGKRRREEEGGEDKRGKKARKPATWNQKTKRKSDAAKARPNTNETPLGVKKPRPSK